MATTKEYLNTETITLSETSSGYSLIIWNDDVNTFDWVIKALTDICDMDELQAEQCSLIVHHRGKCSVLEGNYSLLKAKHTAITDRGIQATIEQFAAI